MDELIDKYLAVKKYWHPTKNVGFEVNEISYGSYREFWWICKNGHEYKMSMKERVKKIKSCDECNSIGFMYPEISKLWHPIKNGKLLPKNISYAADTKVWWQCENGHEWMDYVSKMTLCKKGRCSECSKIEYLKENGLVVKYPEVAKEWHPTKNGDVDINKVTYGEYKSAWWQCEKGHEWEAFICNRTSGAHNCPYCSGRYATKETSLGYNYPELLKEWDYKKNDCTPFDVTVYSHKKVHWKCKNGHKYEMMIFEKVKTKDCKTCYLEENNLKTLFPELIKEWHPTKNGNLWPEHFTYGSSQKVWWMCIKKNMCGFGP